MFLSATVAKQTSWIWQMKRVYSHCKASVVSRCSLSLLPMSFNSIRGQGPTPLPLHPHLLSVFFSRWCNSAVRCRGHHKLTRSLITVDLMSGKERGREWRAERERHWERRRQRAHLHICLETWQSGWEEGRIAAADADIIISIKDEVRKDRKMSNREREREKERCQGMTSLG